MQYHIYSLKRYVARAAEGARSPEDVGSIPGLTPASHLKWTGSGDKLTDPPCLASNNTKLGTSSRAWSFVNVQTDV
jgi:hypothetical protein